MCSLPVCVLFRAKHGPGKLHKRMVNSKNSTLVIMHVHDMRIRCLLAGYNIKRQSLFQRKIKSCHLSFFILTLKPVSHPPTNFAVPLNTSWCHQRETTFQLKMSKRPLNYVLNWSLSHWSAPTKLVSGKQLYWSSWR